MTQCKFTRTANLDLENIIDYSLKHWGKSQTSKYLEELKFHILALSRNPDLGSICDSIFPGLCCFPIKKHVVYYVKENKMIIIVRVLHSNMNPRIHKF